jgi:hypothetical protein
VATKELLKYSRKHPQDLRARHLLFEADRRAKIQNQFGREKVNISFFISVGGEREVSNTTMPLGTTVMEAAYGHLWGLLVQMKEGKTYLHQGFRTRGLEVGDLSFKFSDPRGGPRQIEKSMPADVDDVLIHGDIIWVSERSSELSEERVKESMGRFGL